MSYPAEIVNRELFALALQQSRLAAGLSQRELAERLGVSRGLIGNLESGRDSKIVTALLGVLAETGAVMTIAIPEGEPAPERVPEVLTPEQMEKRLAEAKEDRERNESARRQGLFGHNDYNPGRSRPSI